MTNTELLVLLPVLLPLAGAMVTLLLARQRRAQGIVALLIMASALAVSITLLAVVWRGGAPVVFHSGGWFDGGVPLGITLVGDLLSALLAVMSQFVLLTGIVYALGARDTVVTYPTFYPLFLTLTTGLSGAFLTGDLFNLFVFAELLVISGAVLTANSDDRFGVEAAYKYFYMSLLAAAFLLLACGTLYVITGTLNMADLAARILAGPTHPLIPVAGALLLATFMVKSAVFPFHFWQPDFHAAAPTAVSAMLSSVVVKLGVYGFLRMTTLLVPVQADWVRPLLIGAGAIGVVYGGLAALGTHNAKRMLAYSTVAQVGFILVGIGWGTPAALAAALVFAVNHSLIKAAMLMLAGALASRAEVKSADFAVLTGTGHTAPAAGVLFMLGGMALAGMPPTNGFVGKLMLFQSGIAAEQFAVLALIGVSGILTLLYTMRAFMRIWWENGGADVPARAQLSAAIGKQGDRLLAPVLLIGMVLVLGLWADPLVTLAGDTAAWLLDPSGYLTAVLGD